MNTIAKRIRVARVAAGMTQEQLAKRLKCTRENVTQMEMGVSGTPMHKIPALCRTLKVSADWLFGLANK